MRKVTQSVRTFKMALSLFFMLLLAGNSALSARIAGFCAVGGSQYINTRHTLEELANRGHEVEKAEKLKAAKFALRTSSS